MNGQTIRAFTGLSVHTRSIEILKGNYSLRENVLLVFFLSTQYNRHVVYYLEISRCFLLDNDRSRCHVHKCVKVISFVVALRLLVPRRRCYNIIFSIRPTTVHDITSVRVWGFFSKPDASPGESRSQNTEPKFIHTY